MAGETDKMVGFVCTREGGKYTCQTNMEKIAALERKLEIVTNEKARERSAFMGRIRETSMQQLVDSLHLNLKVQPQPPYKIPK